MKRRHGYLGPLILLTIGFILLFNNLGLLPWHIWWTLWLYWPVILILFGIEIIAKHTESRFIYVLGLLLSVLIIAGTIYLAWHQYPANETIGKNLKGARMNNSQLTDKDFNFANLDDADLSNSNLNGATMNFASMQDTNLNDTSLNGVNMNFADLKNAKLKNGRLSGANLNFANLDQADLSNAALDGANLNFASLDGANMTGARMEGANRNFARTSKSTICPDSLNGPCW